MSDSPAQDLGAHGGVTPGQYYGHGLPYAPIGDYPGRIIAIEGTDGVGRSTQIRLLREWLEVRGYGVIETGWTRSPLMAPTIELAKSSNTLNKLTFVLLYACDFADRLEKEIIPALKAGFIVLADRYIYTLMARDMVRGMDEAWLKNIYGIALEPDAVFYLNVSPEELVQRSFAKNTALDYWESGMDLGLSRDMFDSFLKYQTAMQMTFRHMQSTYGFNIVDGMRSADAINTELRKRIGDVLAGE